jgi:hypothetical protein
MTTNPIEEKVPTVPQGKEDLSREIEQTLERKADERVKAVRVFDDCYRCNWWVQEKTPKAFWLASGSISKSRFIRARRTGTGLQIDNVETVATPRGVR